MVFVYYVINLALKKSGNEIFIDGYVVYASEGVSYLITGIIISKHFFGRTGTIFIMILLTLISSSMSYVAKI